MALLWKKHWKIGNAMLDREHGRLIGIINILDHAMDAKDKPGLLVAIKLLRRCVHEHFANEKRFAQELNFNFEQHDQAHQHLLKELHSTLDELETRSAEPDGAWCMHPMESYSKTLHVWLIEHIVTEDMKMKPLLQSLPHDFIPA